MIIIILREWIIWIYYFSFHFIFCENENRENNLYVNTLLWNDENHKAGWDGNMILYCYFNAASAGKCNVGPRGRNLHKGISSSKRRLESSLFREKYSKQILR